MKSRLRFCSLAVIAELLLSVHHVHSAVFIIPNGDVIAFKNAINTANTNGEDDTIELAHNGTYSLTMIDNNGDDGANGLPVIEDDPGKTLTLRGNGATIRRSIDKRTPDFRILYIRYADFSLSNVTIANGALFGSSYGGGIYNGGAVNLVLSTIAANSSGTGGSGASG